MSDEQFTADEEATIKALAKCKSEERSKLVEAIPLLAKVKWYRRVDYEALFDKLGPARKGNKKLKPVSRLRELDREVDMHIARAKEAAAKTAKESAAADGFTRNEQGDIVPSQTNIRLAVEKLGVRLAYDEFRGMPVIEGLEGFGPALDDHAMSRLWLLIDEKFKFRPTEQFFRTVAVDACLRDRYHPVCDYLDGLTWDGTKRIDTWLCDYFGAHDTPFNRAVGRIVLIAAVRRVRQPGCKFDEALILESVEGLGKSTALAIMAMSDDWFSDSVALNVDDKKMIEGLGGKWIVELAELQGMRKIDIARLKANLSRSRDRARLAYGRLPVEQPRQSIFVGSVNPDPSKAQGYLASLTGNRRFWPVAVGDVDLEALRRDRDQLWAEASEREAAGESIRLPEELWPEAQREQEARETANPLAEIFSEHLASKEEGVLFSVDAWKLTGIPSAQRASHFDKFGAALTSLGWHKRKCRRAPGAEQENAYVKGEQYLSGEGYKEGIRLVPVWNKFDCKYYLAQRPFAGSDEDFVEELTELED